MGANLVDISIKIWALQKVAKEGNDILTDKLWVLRDIKTKTAGFKEDLTSEFHHKIREEQSKFYKQPTFIYQVT